MLMLSDRQNAHRMYWMEKQYLQTTFRSGTILQNFTIARLLPQQKQQRVQVLSSNNINQHRDKGMFTKTATLNHHTDSITRVEKRKKYRKKRKNIEKDNLDISQHQSNMWSRFAKRFSKQLQLHQKNRSTKEARAGAVFRGVGALPNRPYILYIRV